MNDGGLSKLVNARQIMSRTLLVFKEFEMSTFTKCAIAASVVITSAVALNFSILNFNRPGLSSIAGVADSCEGFHCDTFSELPEPSDVLVAAYLRCSDAATHRVLSRFEAEECATSYLRLKLSFLPDVTLRSYKEMTAPQRAEANRRGYQRYMDWKQHQERRFGPLAM